MADGNLFSINLVTPERILLTGQAAEVILRTGDGDTTFLAGHTPLVGTVEPGVVRVVRAEGEEVRIAAHGGFVQVEQNILAEASVAGLGSSTGRSGATGEAEEPDIELVEAEAALLRAQVRLEAVDATSGTTA